MAKVITLDFDELIHSGSYDKRKPTIIDQKPEYGVIKFILTTLEDCDMAICSKRARSPGGRYAMKQWLRTELMAWRQELIVLDPDKKQIKNQILGGLSLSSQYLDDREWADSIIRKIKWPIFKDPRHVEVDITSLIFDGVWPTYTELV